MASRGIRTVTIGRATTIALLLFTTAAIAVATLWFSGRAYTKVDPVPFHQIRLLEHRMAEGPIPFATFVALVSPMLFNMLLFLPWGFLMFVALDTPGRSPAQNYLLVLLLGTGLSAAIEMAQYFLPTRVTDINDVIWNGVGAFVGAILGHIHKRVRISFE